MHARRSMCRAMSLALRGSARKHKMASRIGCRRCAGPVDAGVDSCSDKRRCGLSKRRSSPSIGRLQSTYSIARDRIDAANVRSDGANGRACGSGVRPYASADFSRDIRRAVEALFLFMVRESPTDRFASVLFFKHDRF
jgi:hypothetical protein